MSIASIRPASPAYAAGAAYLDGRYMPLAEAKIPITEWGYRRSDATYDVVSVFHGNFFRLDDHLRRFRASLDGFRFRPQESDDDIRRILHTVVALAGLTESYVAVDCLRGRPPADKPYHPAYARNYIAAFAVPYIRLIPTEKMDRGAHLVIAQAQRISADSVDPKTKNFHWGDLTKGQFEAFDRGADFCVLLDEDGHVTEGPGFNVFGVRDGRIATPIAGVLEGVTRMSVLELCDDLGMPVEVREVAPEELREADEIFLSSTAGGIIPASRIDGRIMGNDRPGPVSERVRETYWRRRAEGWHGVPVDYSLARAVA